MERVFCPNKLISESLTMINIHRLVSIATTIETVKKFSWLVLHLISRGGGKLHSLYMAIQSSRPVTSAIRVWIFLRFFFSLPSAELLLWGKQQPSVAWTTFWRMRRCEFFLVEKAAFSVAFSLCPKVCLLFGSWMNICDVKSLLKLRVDGNNWKLHQ